MHIYLENPTVADAILDRLIHNSYRLALKGESVRKQEMTALPPEATKAIDEDQECGAGEATS